MKTKQINKNHQGKVYKKHKTLIRSNPSGQISTGKRFVSPKGINYYVGTPQGAKDMAVIQTDKTGNIDELMSDFQSRPESGSFNNIGAIKLPFNWTDKTRGVNASNNPVQMPDETFGQNWTRNETNSFKTQSAKHKAGSLLSKYNAIKNKSSSGIKHKSFDFGRIESYTSPSGYKYTVRHGSDNGKVAVIVDPRDNAGNIASNAISTSDREKIISDVENHFTKNVLPQYDNVSGVQAEATQSFTGGKWNTDWNASRKAGIAGSYKSKSRVKNKSTSGQKHKIENANGVGIFTTPSGIRYSASYPPVYGANNAGKTEAEVGLVDLMGNTAGTESQIENDYRTNVMPQHGNIKGIEEEFTDSGLSSFEKFMTQNGYLDGTQKNYRDTSGRITPAYTGGGKTKVMIFPKFNFKSKSGVKNKKRKTMASVSNIPRVNNAPLQASQAPRPIAQRPRLLQDMNMRFKGKPGDLIRRMNKLRNK